MTDAWSNWTAQDRADVINNAVNDSYDNDDCGLTVEAHAAYDTLRAERDSAREWATAYEARLAEVRHYAAERYVATNAGQSHRDDLLRLIDAHLGAPEQVQG